MIDKQRLVDVFCEMAKISSPSGSEEEIARYVLQKLQELGISSVRDAHGNIVARLAGSGEPLILCAHLDTVELGAGKQVNPIIKDGVISSDGTTILGADNKAFVAAILEAVSVLREKDCAHRAIEIVFTLGEEKISEGVRALDYSLLKGKECIIADMGIDPERQFGTIALSAPCLVNFTITVRGKRVHVKSSELGVNAIRTAAAIVTMMPLGKVGQATIVSVAFISGGLAGTIEATKLEDLHRQMRNTVPDLVVLLGEIRGNDKEEFNLTWDIIERFCRQIAAAHGASAELTQEPLAAIYAHDQNDPFIQGIAAIFGQMGIVSTYKKSLGGSDANALNFHGIKAVVISSGEYDNHQPSERISVDNLVKLTEFVVNFVTT